MFRLLRAAVGILWLLSMTLVYAQPAGPRIWIALAEEGGAYAEAAAVLKAELAGRAETEVDVWQKLLREDKSPPSLVVTVGVSAFEGMLPGLDARGAAWEAVPVVATLLPRAAFDAQRGKTGRHPLSAVVLDQPLERQLALIRRALPERQHVGILLGAQSRQARTELNRAASSFGLRLTMSEVGAGDDLYPALRDVLQNADVLLALPDQSIYHGGSLQNILLTTYRARVPMVAFSPAYVRAGAVLAVYSTPAQVARRTASLVLGWQPGRPLPPVQTPREFAVLTNPKVAASLGIRLDDAASIAEDLRRREGGE
jgi:hypothetical protein